jgi:probable rRNA maturation factor
LIDIEVEDPAWTDALPDAEQLVRIAAGAALSSSPEGHTWGEGDHDVVEGAQGGPLRASGVAPPASATRPPPPPSSRHGRSWNVTVLLTDDASVQELNSQFRRKDSATNVLSFPAPPNPEDHLGDVALAYGVCAREAAEQGKPLGDHLQHLTVHGVLHLLGYDHIGDDEAEAMEGLERAVLAGLGVPDPYAAGEGEHERPRPS